MLLFTAVGANALVGNTTGVWNTAVGQGGLAANATGFLNTASGRQAQIQKVSAQIELQKSPTQTVANNQ